MWNAPRTLKVRGEVWRRGRRGHALRRPQRKRRGSPGRGAGCSTSGPRSPPPPSCLRAQGLTRAGTEPGRPAEVSLKAAELLALFRLRAFLTRLVKAGNRLQERARSANGPGSQSGLKLCVCAFPSGGSRQLPKARFQTRTPSGQRLSSPPRSGGSAPPRAGPGRADSPHPGPARCAEESLPTCRAAQGILALHNPSILRPAKLALGFPNELYHLDHLGQIPGQGPLLITGQAAHGKGHRLFPRPPPPARLCRGEEALQHRHPAPRPPPGSRSHPPARAAAIGIQSGAGAPGRPPPPPRAGGAPRRRPAPAPAPAALLRLPLSPALCALSARRQAPAAGAKRQAGRLGAAAHADAAQRRAPGRGRGLRPRLPAIGGGENGSCRGWAGSVPAVLGGCCCREVSPPPPAPPRPGRARCGAIRCGGLGLWAEPRGSPVEGSGFARLRPGGKKRKELDGPGGNVLLKVGFWVRGICPVILAASSTWMGSR